MNLELQAEFLFSDRSLEASTADSIEPNLQTHDPLDAILETKTDGSMPPG
jgi:hypothetical protein